MPFQIEKKEHGVLLTLEGEIYISSVIELKEILVNLLNKNHFIIINISEIKAIDSAMLQLLYSLFKTAAQKNIHMELQGDSDIFTQALKAAGLNKINNPED